jgi:hypothetical protein
MIEAMARRRFDACSMPTRLRELGRRSAKGLPHVRVRT